MSVPGRARPATAADVARRAGVSPATVSHILNRPDCRHPLRNQGEEMHDAIGRAQVSELLKRGPKRIVYAGLSSHRMDPFEPGRLAGVEHACAEAGLPTPLRIEIEPKAAAAGRGIKQLPDGPVGIAAYNDTVAIALLTA